MKGSPQRNTTIIIEGELADLNTYINAERRHRFLASKLKKEETHRVAVSASGFAPVTSYPVTLTYNWYSKNSRKDVDNVAFAKKFINDGLVDAGVLEDDARKFVSGFSDCFFIDADRPRVEVVIHTADTATM